MQLNRRHAGAGFLIAILGLLAMLLLSGCAFKPGYLQGAKTDVPYRWKVTHIDPARVSDDQRAILEQRGVPSYVRFFREVQTRKPIYAWIYLPPDRAVDLVWFAAGKRVEEVAVDSDPSAFRSSTRRRARIALLVGTGAAIVPTVVLLANR